MPALARAANEVDVAIVGAGPSGLSAALALVRSRKRVALYDTWPPRNAAATEVRGFVTQDGTPPAEMRAHARAQLAAYPTLATYDDDRVTSIEGTRGAFTVISEHRSSTARRVMLCLGLVDVLPDLPGYRALWGRAVFQCPNCHAWEVRDRRFGYLAPSESCAEWALLLRGWTTDLVVFTNGEFSASAQLAGVLDAARVRIETRRVVGLRADGDNLAAVQLEAGAEVLRDVLFVRPPQVRTPLVQALVARGLRLDAPDLVHTNDRCETSVPGIYAAGDLATHTHGALAAAAAGSAAAHWLDEELTRELVLSRVI